MSFAGQSIIITGGTIGLGYELIQHLLKRGAQNIAVLDINDKDNAIAKLQALYPNGQKVIYLKTNVADRDNVFRSFREAHSLFGTIDVVIGNAGILDENRPELVIQINLIGVINSTLAAIETMGKTNGGNGGTVMNIASVCGLNIYGVMPSYTASKHGIVGLTRCYATDLYKDLGIEFVVVCPSASDTDILRNLDSKFVSGINVDGIRNSHKVNGKMRPEHVGACLANILENPKESTVYIIGDDEVKPITIPDYWRR